MRKRWGVFECALISALFCAGAASADGFTDKNAWAVRKPSGPTDSRLVGKEPVQAPSSSAAPKTGAPSTMDAAASSNPPVAPAVAEEPAPTPPVKTEPSAVPQSMESQPFISGPVWENRWFWALLALLLLLGAGSLEYFGRKRDERLAAEEPDDAPAHA